MATAGLVGAGLGSLLAKLSGSDGSATPPVPAAVRATATSTSAVAVATLAAQTTAAPGLVTTLPSPGDHPPPRIEVFSAQLGAPSRTTGRALVAARIRLSNRADRPLQVQAPTLLSEQDEIPVNASPSGAADSLVRRVAAGASATGTLRFTVAPAVARRLTSEPSARLRIAQRTVALKLTKKSR